MSASAADASSTTETVETAPEEEVAILPPVKILFLGGPALVLDDLKAVATVGAAADVVWQRKKPAPPMTAIYRLVLGERKLDTEEPLVALLCTDSDLDGCFLTLTAVIEEPRLFNGHWGVVFDDYGEGLGTWTISNDDILYDDPTVAASYVVDRIEHVNWLSFTLKMQYADDLAEDRRGFSQCTIVLKPDKDGALLGTQIAKNVDGLTTRMTFRMYPIPREAEHDTGGG
eukprot:TRINITY_DN19724_c0_g1_i3.p1 TRINITY_DN19724_c0_g1~~TRINITY_DN19724_c0_g1_i3.p1  ORF type:complete len:229 (-),score=59.74 TRINITY_DN19724_c0_g1_i3:596-1282(-)